MQLILSSNYWLTAPSSPPLHLLWWRPCPDHPLSCICILSISFSLLHESSFTLYLFTALFIYLNLFIAVMAPEPQKFKHPGWAYQAFLTQPLFQPEEHISTHGSLSSTCHFPRPCHIDTTASVWYLVHWLTLCLLPASGPTRELLRIPYRTHTLMKSFKLLP